MSSDWSGRSYSTANPGYRTYTRRPQPQPQEPAEDFEFGGTGFSDFFERFFGGLGGSGRRGSYSEGEPTRGQDVEADIMVTLEEALEGGVRPITLRRTSDCVYCQGSGIQGRRVCPNCAGQGQQSTTQRYRVKIPAGVRDGQRLRIAGQGEPGDNGGPSGDLYLRVRMASHPDFRVEGSDLYHDLELAPWEAALGASVNVPTVNGSVNIKIPPGTQNGHRLRIRAHGLPSRNGEHGDLYVVARIHMPTSLTERERALWQELAKESRFNPRT
jgi:curved DNA-binding protein